MVICDERYAVITVFTSRLWDHQYEVTLREIAEWISTDELEMERNGGRLGG